MQAVTIRQATDADRAAIARLAALDSQRHPQGPAVLAYVEGELHALLDLEANVVIADPFRHTALLGELLRVRAEQMAAAERRAGGGRRGLHLGLRPLGHRGTTAPAGP